MTNSGTFPDCGPIASSSSAAAACDRAGVVPPVATPTVTAADVVVIGLFAVFTLMRIWVQRGQRDETFEAALSTLGVSYPYDAATLRTAWRRVALTTHPDHSRDKGRAFIAARKAYEVLSARLAVLPVERRLAPQAAPAFIAIIVKPYPIHDEQVRAYWSQPDR